MAVRGGLLPVVYDHANELNEVNSKWLLAVVEVKGGPTNRRSVGRTGPDTEISAHCFRSGLRNSLFDPSIIIEDENPFHKRENFLLFSPVPLPRYLLLCIHTYTHTHWLALPHCPCDAFIFERDIRECSRTQPEPE